MNQHLEIYNKIILVILLMIASLTHAEEGIVVPQSLLNQVEEGNAEVAFFIAQMMFDGNDKHESDKEKGLEWLEKSATMGYTHAMGALADEYHSIDDKEKALNWYIKAADAGLAYAFNSIANYHLEGSAGLNKDCIKAYEWYEKAEIREVKSSFNDHAWNLATSEDVNCRNPEKALMIYSKLKAILVAGDEVIPWSFWDTEAAILASVSDFSAAIKLQQWIIKEMTSRDMDTEIYQQHLDKYLLRQPWIEAQ